MKHESDERTQQIIKQIKIYDDFPKPGVRFLDVFSLLADPPLMDKVLDIFQAHLSKVEFTKLFMLQSRGFLFAVPLSLRMNKPCYPVRKKGKLPGEVSTFKYSLQYGFDQIEVQKQAITPGDKVVLVDDVLATGGTINAATQLVQQQGGEVVGVIFVNIVKQLGGLDRMIVPRERVFYIFDS